MFKGSITALITPMKDDSSVDTSVFQKFVDWQIKQGTHGLVPVGTTGESPTLTHEEHKLVVQLCVEAADKRVPVIAGAGSNNTVEAVGFIQHAEKVGADAALIVTPYYNKPSQEGLYQHFKAIHDAADLPVIIYNIPGRSVVDMSVETMARLFELPRIVGVKDATGDMNRCADQRAAMGPEFVQLSGDDSSALGFNAMGGVGSISVSSNVAPKLCSEFQEATLAGNFAKALELQDKLLPLHRAMFMEPSPAPAKYAGSLIGTCGATVRMPILPVSDEAKTAIRKAVEDLELETVDFG
ncbi:4-hydroxy-tetrahydrodipicolinate synthase [Kordiimonas sp. SCSIO 12603]|uniref:4-hydroxy-tetrahydrodipicolinate synthase n=1 Tax=Kordiimonas sp. SCSIO 12603 TaxID=2829596 RepID=UPI0021037B3A|nr:4-hydroxy-tetrahydrodipicolinate synthase [Kordiimonas sp. SCSIO 12603]UTW57057.1 4-hydroxy-tetrahydrodipicolinate synthase [Kordiimonas sp. SCSIO 12603]